MNNYFHIVFDTSDGEIYWSGSGWTNVIGDAISFQSRDDADYDLRVARQAQDSAWWHLIDVQEFG